MECSPTANVEVEKVAVAEVLPEADTANADASVVVVPVKVTLCPSADGLGLEVTTVLVAYNGSAVPTSSILRGEVGNGVPAVDSSATSIIGVSWVLVVRRGEAGGAKAAPTTQSTFWVRVWPLVQELVIVVSNSASGGLGGVSTVID